MKKLFYIFAFVAFALTSCDKNEVNNLTELTEPIAKAVDPVDPEMIKLGKKRENPYSVENIRKAYQALQADGLLRAPMNIQATNLYVRFLPKTEDEYQALKKQGYELFDYPLEYERVEGGSYYHDPNLPKDGFTWIYVVLPVDYVFGDIQYEIISELVLQDESEASGMAAAQKVKAIDTNDWSLIEEKSFELTGNEYYSKKESTNGMMKVKVKPSGRITIEDDVLKREIGIEGVKVRASRWFTAKYGYTNSNGEYTFNYTFNGPVDYSIVWEREDWDIRHGVWAQATYNGPNTVTNSWSVKINNSNIQFVYANVHRACFTYWFNISSFGIKTPPKDSSWSPRVKIGVYDTAGRAYASPLLRWFTIPSICIYSHSKYDNGTTVKNTSAWIYQTTIHELAHTSHWEIDKDLFWSIDQILVESWAVGVAYEIPRKIYPVSSLSRWDWQHITKAKIIDMNDLERKYTPIVIDLMDTTNQSVMYGDTTQYANDKVSGYTLQQIENAIKKVKTLNGLKNNLKSMYDNPSEEHLDKLFEFYTNL
ncbi:MAG: hypothetical protein BWY08_01845 [Bacteroidetes bacterium ADurb.Bin174]|nr:MAG: hypothetical protein BWY08_01845 [Bacteroidetes bacterium ADurb.Bin174]